MKDIVAALYQCKIDIMRAFLERKFPTRPLPSLVKKIIFKGENKYCPGNVQTLLIMPESVKTLKFEQKLCETISIDESMLQHYRVSGGDIVFVLEGEYVGSCAIIPVFSEGGIIDNRCAGISLDGTVADPFYVVNILHYFYRTSFFSTIMNASGRFSTDELGTISIPLPNLETQKRISLLLLEVSGIIENIKLLEEEIQ